MTPLSRLFVFLFLTVATSLGALPPVAPHPRLLADRTTWDRVAEGVRSDPVWKAWHARLRSKGEALLKRPPYQYELRDGVRLLMVSRDVLNVVTTEAYLYRIDGDQRFLDRAWAELDNVARFADWHPAHFLDVAEMAAAVALGYDWLEGALTEAQKQELRQALVDKALKPAAPFLEKQTGWAAVTNNWNFVCNGGITLAALAIADEDPSWYRRLVPQVLASLPRALPGYAPDGAWNESPGYWDYGTTYLVELIASLQTSLGSDFGLLETPGLDKTGNFAVAMSGPGKYFFGYGDVGGSRGWVSSSALWYLGRAYRQPLLGWARKTAVGNAPQALDLLWYDPAQTSTDPASAGMPTDQRFRRVEVATFRASWSDPGALFVGFKGTAFPDRNHTDLDNGSFFLGAGGEVWITDLGSDDYNLPGYFTMDVKKADNRWNLYRKRAEGHNTLVINPGPGPDQIPAATAPLTAFHPGSDRAWAVADLTQVYPGARNVRRGVLLTRGKTRLTVEDEVRLASPGEVWWFAHLDPGVVVQVAEDGRSAVLSRPGKADTVEVRLTGGPADLRLSLAEATPLDTSVRIKQNPNTGLKKLVLHASGFTEGRWAVEFVPRPAGSPEPEPPEALVPLDNWR